MKPSTQDAVAEAYERHGGNISAIARELNIDRHTVRYHLDRLGISKPLVGGSLSGVTPEAEPLPASGQIKRYIVTSAQNNTRLNERVWKNLLALAKYYKAQILVGTYSYNRGAYGALAVKRGTVKREHKLWFDERIEPFLADRRMELAHGLVWCGEMNIIPTASDPLSGLETYSQRRSAIFPHAKVAMRSIATMKGEGTKLNYTTGTVTQMNYIQKKAGLVAEHHHSYGGLLVEVNSAGNWWVRQLDADERGRIQDLDIRVDTGTVTTGHAVEAITWGDLHAARIEPIVLQLATGEEGMLRALRPKYQFIHDLLEGASVNHHYGTNPHEQFKAFLLGYDSVQTELLYTAELLKKFLRKGTQTVVVDSNHDNWFTRWLREHDYRRDPGNALLFLEAQLQVYRDLSLHATTNLTEWLMRKHGCSKDVRFLQADESFTICNRAIECGMHGHLGPAGARGSASNLSRVGRRANIGHTHSAGIFNGLYVAGTSSLLDMGYNRGPSSWTHSHIVTYPNGKRTIVTMYADKWRA